MNITEYRAMKAQEEASKSEGVTSNAQTQPTSTEPQSQGAPTQTENTPTQSTQGTEGTAQTPPSETKTDQPTKITIEGIGEITIDELKNGYLRQSDYTKKTQTLAQQQRELANVAQLYDKVKENPERAQQLAQEFNVPQLDPQVDFVTELQNKYHDLLLEKEIGEMQAKYPDFEVREVLEVAQAKKLTNLEDAYHIVKATKSSSDSKDTPIDVNSIKEQIRQELLKELELERNTTSIITSGNGAPVTNNQPVLSDAELRVARNMGMPPEEYAKWRDR